MFQRISIDEAKNLIAQGNIKIFDTRDELAYKTSRLANAQLLDKNNLLTVCQTETKNQAILLYCYHGNSSQTIAQIMVNQGFEKIYSMDGGFEAWKKKHEVE